ncbi:hypothetical protein ABT354_33045 [Streptomyces sp. NPDC000594]|uniref:hypothetical protein n=1 Tax=Streptomyces sp. NPDC000594 TaxID=3154261 RepID=UPI0033200E44
MAHPRPIKAIHAALFADVSGALVGTPYRLANGHGCYHRPERREGLSLRRREAGPGAAVVSPGAPFV